MAIVIVTLLTITQKTYLPNVSFGAKTMICLSTWAVPIITSTTAVAMRAMSPVSGNWCWITAKRTDLRYALTHGWRVAIIFVTVLLYAYIWWYVRCHFKSLFGAENGRSGSYNPLTGQVISEKDRLRNMSAEQVALKGRGQHLHSVIDSDNAPSRARTPPSGELVRQNEDPRRKSSVSTEPLIQSTQQQPRGPCQGIDDATMRSWSPLQKPAQARMDKKYVFYPAVSGLTQGHDCNAVEDSREGIVRSYDFHVSFAEQHPLQKLSSTSNPVLSPPPDKHPDTMWPHSQMTTISCTATNSSSTTKSPFNTQSEGQNHLPHGSSSDAPRLHNSRGFEKEIRRMLLLNAYPTLYVLLWIPGIVNRFMEATGTAPSNTRIVGALQSTSQFVGFANALTFGLSAAMRRRIASAASSTKWSGRRWKV